MDSRIEEPEMVEFYAYARGETMEEAFNVALDRNREIHGDSGKTGTLADKDSCVYIMMTLSHQEAEAHAGRLMDSSDPRVSREDSPAGAIRIMDDPENGKRWLFFGKAVYEPRG